YFGDPFHANGYPACLLYFAWLPQVAFHFSVSPKYRLIAVSKKQLLRPQSPCISADSRQRQIREPQRPKVRCGLAKQTLRLLLQIYTNQQAAQIRDDVLPYAEPAIHKVLRIRHNTAANRRHLSA